MNVLDDPLFVYAAVMTVVSLGLFGLLLAAITRCEALEESLNNGRRAARELSGVIQRYTPEGQP